MKPLELVTQGADDAFALTRNELELDCSVKMTVTEDKAYSLSINKQCTRRILEGKMQTDELRVQT